MLLLAGAMITAARANFSLPCSIAGGGPVLYRTTNTYTAAYYTNAAYSWALTNNGTAAEIVGSSTNRIVRIVSGNRAGTFEIQVTSSIPIARRTCSEVVAVYECSITGSASATTFTTNIYTAPVVNGATYKWSLANNNTGAGLDGGTTGAVVKVISGIAS